MKEKFIQFLKRENVYERFVDTFSRERKEYDDLDKYIVDIIKDPGNRYLVIGAFNWDNVNFWLDINNKWQEELL